MTTICPLCPPQLSSSDHDQLWYALQEQGYEGVIKAAEAEGFSITKRQLRAHFEYHRPRQARPHKRWRQAKALTKAEMLTNRQRAILDLCFRVPALGGDTIGMLLYWNGQEDKLLSADKAALRNIRTLMKNDFIFRSYLENISGGGNRPDKISGMYFLGANGRAYVEQQHQLTVSAKEWAQTDKELSPWTSVYHTYQSNQLISELIRQLPGDDNGRWLADSRGRRISLPPENWLGTEAGKIKFKDPINKATKIEPAGLLAPVLTQPDGQTYLLPFFYHHDSGSGRLDKLLLELQSHHALARAGELRTHFPQFQHGTIPVLLFSSRSREVLEASQAVPTMPGDTTPIYIVDTAAINVLTQRSCYRMFYRPRIGDTIEPLSLLDLLLRHHQTEPTAGNVLQWRR